MEEPRKAVAISGTREMEVMPLKRLAFLRKQLAAANERLVTLEREQREVRKTIAALREQLKQSASEQST